MINKCINCCKWITCSNDIKENCKDFRFERIEIKKGDDKDEKRKRNKKSNKTFL